MTFALAVVLGAVVSPIAGWLGKAVGLVDHPSGEDLKIHGRPTSLTGGVAVLAAAAVSAWAVGERQVPGLWLAVLIAFVIGTIDDRSPLVPAVRVTGLLLAGIALVFVVPAVRDAGPTWWLAAAALVLVCANAMNIVDGQDGLAGGLGAISALGLAVMLTDAGLDGSAMAAVAVSGAMGGFLVWNRPPARIFLGNGGAYGVGTLLGALGWSVAAVGGLRGLVAAGACLGPFAFEVVFTVLRRAGSRDGLATGDRLHSYDLVAQRVGRTASTAVFLVLGLLSVGVGLLVWFAPEAGVPVAGLGAVLATVWGVLLWSKRHVPTLRDGADLRQTSDPDAELPP